MIRNLWGKTIRKFLFRVKSFKASIKPHFYVFLTRRGYFVSSAVENGCYRPFVLSNDLPSQNLLETFNLNRKRKLQPKISLEHEVTFAVQTFWTPVLILKILEIIIKFNPAEVWNYVIRLKKAIEFDSIISIRKLLQ